MKEKKSPIDEINEFYEQALIWLKKEEHGNVSEIFKLIFNKDVELKDKIYKALAPQDESDMLDEDELNDLILVEGHFSLLRINLIIAITDLISGKYEDAKKFLKFNLQESSRISTIARKTIKSYEVLLEKLKAPDKGYRTDMYKATKEIFSRIYALEEEDMARMTQYIMSLEQDLVKDFE
jgi:hypothetical protein